MVKKIFKSILFLLYILRPVDITSLKQALSSKRALYIYCVSLLTPFSLCLQQLSEARAGNHPAAYLKLLCPTEQVELHTYDCRWRHCESAFVHQEALVSHVNDAHVKVERDVEYKCHWADCPRRGRGFNAR